MHEHAKENSAADHQPTELAFSDHGGDGSGTCADQAPAHSKQCAAGGVVHLGPHWRPLRWLARHPRGRAPSATDRKATATATAKNVIVASMLAGEPGEIPPIAPSGLFTDARSATITRPSGGPAMYHGHRVKKHHRPAGSVPTSIGNPADFHSGRPTARRLARRPAARSCSTA
jgi:hypothetical protein